MLIFTKITVLLLILPWRIHHQGDDHQGDNHKGGHNHLQGGRHPHQGTYLCKNKYFFLAKISTSCHVLDQARQQTSNVPFHKLFNFFCYLTVGDLPYRFVVFKSAMLLWLCDFLFCYPFLAHFVCRYMRCGFWHAHVYACCCMLLHLHGQWPSLVCIDQWMFLYN